MSLTARRHQAQAACALLLTRPLLTLPPQEGATLLNLGFSPLWDLRRGVLSKGLLPAWWALWGGGWMFRHCNRLYGFRSLAFSRWGRGSVEVCVCGGVEGWGWRVWAPQLSCTFTAAAAAAAVVGSQVHTGGLL
jgi:hypothetical protein